MNRNLLIVGASRGIGLAVAEFYAAKGDNIISVSRTPSTVGDWVEADISKPDGIERVLVAISEQTIDALLFVGGRVEKACIH